MLSTDIAAITVTPESTPGYNTVKAYGRYLGLLHTEPLGYPEELRGQIAMFCFSPDALENEAELDDRTVSVLLTGDRESMIRTIAQMYRAQNGIEVPF